jgi:HK97 family phage portal protein
VLRIFENGVMPTLLATGAERKRDTPGWSDAQRAFAMGRDLLVAPSIVSTFDAWRESVWVRLSIEATANVLAQLPFEVYRGTKKQEKHRLLDLIENSNPILGLSKFDLIYQLVVIRELFGECFWLLERKEKLTGIPSAIWCYHPWAVQEVINQSTGELLAWQFQLPGGGFRFVDPSDVAHFPRYDPLNHNPMRPTRGTSALISAGLATSADLAAQRYNMGFFDRGLAPDGIVSTADEMDKDSADEFLDRVRAKLQRKSHEPLLLHSGATWTSTHTSPREAEFLGGRKMNREEIVAAFKVPPFVVGILDEANFANARQALRNWWQVSLNPSIESVCTVIGRKLLGGEPGTTCTLNNDGVEELQETKKEKIDNVKALTEMGVPYNIAEKWSDLGTGPIPGGEIGYIAIGKQPIETAAEPKPDPLANPTPNNPKDNQDPSGDTPAANTVPKQTAKFDLLSVARALVPHVVEKRDASDDVITAILQIIRGDDAALVRLAKRFHLGAFEAGARQIAELLNINANALVPIDNPRVVKFLQEKANQIVSVNETTAERIVDTIKEMLGDKPEEIAGAIKDLYNLRDAQAKLIGRQEVGSSLNGGRFLQLLEIGVERHDWLSSRDDRVREDHQSEDGNVVAVGQPFPVTGLLFPQDPNGDPRQVIGCRCITLPSEATRAMREFNRDEYWRKAMTNIRPLEKSFAGQLEKFFYTQRASVLRALSEFKAA